MLLYIVRHGEAGQHGDPAYPDDSLRPLTKPGNKSFKKFSRKLVKRGISPKVVFTSPLVRCRQTAELLVGECPESPELVEHAALAPESDLQQLIAATRERDAAEVAWVGHAPDVGQLAAALIGSDTAAIDVAKGAVVCVRFHGELAAGDGELLWMATPQLLKC